MDQFDLAEWRMTRFFNKDLLEQDQFIFTMELVPKAESTGRSIDTILQFAKQAKLDGRLSAVSITDNPGGHPSLSPDVLGKEILDSGMDVIVHFTCRDMNRMGIESRALQLRRMGMKHILALTGDYTSKGFGGEGAPVFDIDSVLLLCQLSLLNHTPKNKEESDAFFLGCAVSPFKWTEPEIYAQYYKLCKKISSGADFIITQLGYDARKFQELIQFLKMMTIRIPALASIYFLTPKSARVMYSGRIPGAVVRKDLFETIKQEWETDPRKGYFASIERAARLAAICKGLGYKGVHICGIHRNFKTVTRIMDRMVEIQHQWPEFLDGFNYSKSDDFYVFVKHPRTWLSDDVLIPQRKMAGSFQKMHFKFLYLMNRIFFRLNTPYGYYYKKICKYLDQNRFGYDLVKSFEDGMKQILLACRRCGDCGIEHVGFLCPESQCPKHIRNGACGGSRDGKCEVDADRFCVWYLAYTRLATIHKQADLSVGCVPPRMWELNNTSSWVNYHLGRDHQNASSYIKNQCTVNTCLTDNDDQSIV
jgi:methylenetetrahydrofolate reductase (NADPH)